MNRPKSRGNGNGSVYRLNDGSYRASVTLEDGRRVTRKPARQTRSATDALLRELLAERDRGTLGVGDVTLAEYAPVWLDSLALKNLSSRTIELYEERLTVHILPTLGRLPLRKLTPAHVERLYTKLLRSGSRRPRPPGAPPEGLSPRTVVSIHGVLSGLLKSAKRRRPPLVAENVCEMVDPPVPGRYRARILSAEELRRLLAVIADHQHGPLWTFLIGTGARFGAAAGLPWSAVDLDAGVACLVQVAVRTNTPEGWRVVLRPGAKTEAGEVLAALTRWAVEALEAQRTRVAELRRAAGTAWQECGLVFPRDNGLPLWEAHVNRAWHRMLEANGFGYLRMHDLRHSKATLMVDELDEQVTVVQRTLGHANPTITSMLYVGKVQKALRRAADRYGELLEPRPRA